MRQIDEGRYEEVAGVGHQVTFVIHLSEATLIP